MSDDIVKPFEPKFGSLSPDFEKLVTHIFEEVGKDNLAKLRKDFHSHFRITLSQPESADLVEDLWDFFYDWAFFEMNLPEDVKALSSTEKDLWRQVKAECEHGLFVVSKVAKKELFLKESFSGKPYTIAFEDTTNLGLKKNDMIEGRLLLHTPGKKPTHTLLRRPSYHEEKVHPYIKSKVKEFKKAKDFVNYQAWLWGLVGMYIKHRIYQQMPVEKIYDDNSRI